MPGEGKRLIDPVDVDNFDTPAKEVNSLVFVILDFKSDRVPLTVGDVDDI
jgi:hypothetical protein